MDNNSLVNIALAVAIVVVICLTLTFTLLYLAYGKYKRLSIKSGQEDNDLLVQIKKMDDKFETSKTKNNDVIKTYTDKLNYQNGHLSPLRITYLTLYSLILTFVSIVMIVSFVYRGSGEMLYANDTTYIIIQTGSMSKVYEGNEYIEENNLTDQIQQYSMIGIEKVEEDELELYDVVAFYIGKDIYVHRLISIATDEKGINHYCFRGDANNASFAEECYIEFDQIIGKYNGFQSLFLGVSITYLQSNIGIISMFMAAAFLVNLEIQEEFIDKEYLKRKKELCSLLDKGEISLLDGEKEK